MGLWQVHFYGKDWIWPGWRPVIWNTKQLDSTSAEGSSASATTGTCTTVVLPRVLTENGGTWVRLFTPTSETWGTGCGLNPPAGSTSSLGHPFVMT